MAGTEDRGEVNLQGAQAICDLARSALFPSSAPALAARSSRSAAGSSAWTLHASAYKTARAQLAVNIGLLEPSRLARPTRPDLSAALPDTRPAHRRASAECVPRRRTLGSQVRVPELEARWLTMSAAGVRSHARPRTRCTSPAFGTQRPPIRGSQLAHMCCRAGSVVFAADRSPRSITYLWTSWGAIVHWRENGRAGGRGAQDDRNVE